MLSDFIKFTVDVECEQKLPFLVILVRRTESNFEYSVYCNPTNKNDLLHFFLFPLCKNKKSVLSGSFLVALRVCSPINLKSSI